MRTGENGLFITPVHGISSRFTSWQVAILLPSLERDIDPTAASIQTSVPFQVHMQPPDEGPQDLIHKINQPSQLIKALQYDG